MSQLRRFGAENKGEFTENRIALSNNGSNSSNSKNNFSSYTLPTNTLATDSSNQWCKCPFYTFIRYKKVYKV